MPYGTPVGIRRPWQWDCPTLFQAQRVDLAAQAVGTIQELLASEPGQWNNARLVVAVPVAWLDVVFELWVRVGSAWLPLRRATPRLSAPVISGGRASATLFHHCGFPCDQWSIRARSTGLELGQAELSLQVWGTEVCDDTMEPAHLNGGELAGTADPDFSFPTSEVLFVDRPTTVRSVYGTVNLLAAAERWVMLFDRDTLPPAPPPNIQPSRAPVGVILPGGAFSWAPTEGDPFAVGLVVGLSDTFDFYTPSTDTMHVTAYFD